MKYVIVSKGSEPEFFDSPDEAVKTYKAKLGHSFLCLIIYEQGEEADESR